MRVYRGRASEFELLAENEPLSEVKFVIALSPVIIASWLTVDERSDKAKMAERLELLKLARREAAE